MTTIAASIALASGVAGSLAAPAKSEPTSVADVARALAADTQRLADARSELRDVRSERADVSKRQRRLRVQVEARLVSLYKYGGGVNLLAQAASGGSVKEVGTSLDTLDVVAEHESRTLKAWAGLVKRNRQLATRAAQLEKAVAAAKKAVRRARIRLSKAEAAAAKAREAAERMAAIQDSPVLPRVGHPENVATQSADGDDDAALSAQEQPVGFTQSGVASMYADDFAGEKTANGERYDPNAFTAAHLTLPLGTWVTVTGPGGSVAVRINDRGPYVGARVIDLSRAAAEAIGLMGLGQVTIAVQA